MFEKVRIRSAESSEDPRAWSQALEQLEHPELIKSETTKKRISAVYRATLLGSRVAVKADAPIGLRGLGVQLGLDHTHAHRQWSGATTLRAAGIETATPFVRASARWTHADGTHAAEIVVIEWLEGRTLLEVLAHEQGPDRARILNKAGQLTARMVRSMILNRDHKPSNIVVLTPRGNTDPTLSLIDTVGIRAGVLPDRASQRMLRDLMLEPIGVGAAPTGRDIAAFLRGLDAEGFWAARDTNERRTLRRALICDLRERVARHGDPTPKINPLDTGSS